MLLFHVKSRGITLVALFVVHTKEAQKCLLLDDDDDDRHGQSVEQYHTDAHNTSKLLSVEWNQRGEKDKKKKFGEETIIRT